MSEEHYVTIAEVKELLTKENERRIELMGDIEPAVRIVEPAEGEEAGEPVVEEITAFNQVQKDAMAHAEATSRISKDSADKLVNELLGMSFKDKDISVSLKDNGTAYKIADILPKYPEDVRAIFSKERVKLEAEDISKIIDTVKKYQ